MTSTKIVKMYKRNSRFEYVEKTNPYIVIVSVVNTAQ